jgi:hypothetical protein
MAGEKVSKVSLVDLAGSERANSTGATVSYSNAWPISWTY